MVFEFGFAKDKPNLQQYMASLLHLQFLKHVLIISPLPPSFYKMLIAANVSKKNKED